MVIETSDLQEGRHLQYDVCVIGAGAAGITVTRALRRTGTSIGLLESGGFDFDDDTQALYQGTTTSSILGRGYLTSTRLRYFGGTTNHWNGMCRPLDESDFIVRPWVPHSGWPITAADLAPFYRQASAVPAARCVR